MESRSANTPRGPSCWAHIPVVRGVGALVIVGGGGTPPLVHDLFFHLAGDQQAHVIHLPSATRLFDDIPNKREYYCEFYDPNPASFDFLHTYDRAVAEQPEFSEPLNRATGVWIGGGTQGRLSDLFVGTEVVRGIHRVLDRGGVVAGTSSGAAIMSDAMICFGREEIEFGQGFALYPQAIVDTHFTHRKRAARVARAVLLRPDHIGVGIDDQTALVVQGNHVGVIGPDPEDGSVWFHFPDAAGGRVTRYRLNIGETIELPARVRGADPRILEERLRAVRAPDVVTAEELAPEPESTV
jgi:cyanophycinase